MKCGYSGTCEEPGVAHVVCARESLDRVLCVGHRDLLVRSLTRLEREFSVTSVEGFLDLTELTPEQIEAVRRALDKEYPPEPNFRE